MVQSSAYGSTLHRLAGLCATCLPSMSDAKDKPADPSEPKPEAEAAAAPEVETASKAEATTAAEA